ncbi:MAG: MFS transporter [Dehalococcoidia bacterium]|nr:MFS transporter [Dehalococcoidia bacterium]
MRRPKIFYGWWIVLVSLMADGMKHGSFNRGFTVMYIPIEQDLGFTRTMLGLAEGLGRMMGGIQGPIMGYCTDRFGPRIMLAFGGLMSGLGFILLAQTGSFWFFLVIFVGFLSVGFRSGYNNASIMAVNNWFRRRRGLAMSVVSMGNGLGGATAPLVGLLIFTVGWRDACMVLGFAIIAVVIPLSWFLRRSPEEMGQLPDGDTPEAVASAAAAQTGQTSAIQRRQLQFGEMDFTVGEAMRTPSYWLLIMSTGFRNIVHAGASFLLHPLMVWFLEGGGPDVDGRYSIIAAALVGAFSFTNMVFNPGMGWLGDKVDRRKLSAICMVAGAAALALLITQSGQVWLLVLFVGMMAFAESANPLNWAIMGDFFGRRSYATLRGWQHLPDQLASMWTAMWMGAIYDHTGSFYWALFPLVALYVFAAIGYWFLPFPRLPQRLQAQREREAAREAAASGQGLGPETGGTAEAAGRAD